MHSGQEDPFDYEPYRQILLATWPRSVGSDVNADCHLMSDIKPDRICKRQGRVHSHFLYQSVLRRYPHDLLSV